MFGCCLSISLASGCTCLRAWLLVTGGIDARLLDQRPPWGRTWQLTHRSTDRLGQVFGRTGTVSFYLLYPLPYPLPAFAKRKEHNATRLSHQHAPLRASSFAAAAPSCCSMCVNTAMHFREEHGATHYAAHVLDSLAVCFEVYHVHTKGPKQFVCPDKSKHPPAIMLANQAEHRASVEH